MISRRMFCGCALAACGLSASAANAQIACEYLSPQGQAGISPTQAIQRLKDDNDRMLAGKSINCDANGMFRKAGAGQAPIAAIISCIDSRAAPEIVFDQHLGDIFVARVAGNIANVDIIGSLEYATKVAGAKAIVVLGHSKCGAIKSAVDGVKMGNITALLKQFEPALATLKPADGKRDSHNDVMVQKVALANAMLTAQNLTKRSAIIKKLVEDKQLSIVAAMEDVSTGKVTWL